MAFDEKYRNVTIKGSHFPGAKYRNDVDLKLNREMLGEYIPTLKRLGLKKGFELLLVAMADKEGFSAGTRSYRNNNPGNIGNTDSGANVKFATLEDGIRRQVQFINDLVAGKLPAYPMGKLKVIPPRYSEEIAKNAKVYGMSPWLPGYEFTFTGQIDQFVKIYSTGARAGNNYINNIVSHFHANGLKITPESKIQDIIKLQ